MKKVSHLLCLIFYYQVLPLISSLDLPLFLSPLLNSSLFCSPSLLLVTSSLPFCSLWLPLQAAARTAGAFVWQVQGSGPGSQRGVGPPAVDCGAVPGQGPRRGHQTLRAGWRLCQDPDSAAGRIWATLTQTIDIQYSLNSTEFVADVCLTVTLEKEDTKNLY